MKLTPGVDTYLYVVGVVHYIRHIVMNNESACNSMCFRSDSKAGSGRVPHFISVALKGLVINARCSPILRC